MHKTVSGLPGKDNTCLFPAKTHKNRRKTQNIFVPYLTQRVRFTNYSGGNHIGAVTYVLVKNPTTGYGIFIENMQDAAAGGGV